MGQRARKGHHRNLPLFTFTLKADDSRLLSALVAKDRESGRQTSRSSRVGELIRQASRPAPSPFDAGQAAKLRAIERSIRQSVERARSKCPMAEQRQELDEIAAQAMLLLTIVSSGAAHNPVTAGQGVVE